jgi:hypothetical protein
MILGAAVQLMMAGNYHTGRKQHGQTDMAKLRERRLFWNAYVLDHHLALRLGNPPITNLDLALPERLPTDGLGIVTFDSGVTLNMLREQVALARIQGKIYSLLYAKDASTRSAHEDVRIISDLDSELCAWKAHVPDINRSTGVKANSKDAGLMCITILHYTYYQLLIVLHSFVFQSSSAESEDYLTSSIALAVGAARATISLLDFHEDCHPFSL